MWKHMTMNKIIGIVLLTVISFTVTIIICNIRMIQIQDTLISSFYLLMMAELAAMGGIKITKTIKSEDNDQQEEEVEQEEIGNDDENNSMTAG